MQAKFPGKCGCGAKFAVGTEVRWEKGVGVIGCPSCSNAPANQPGPVRNVTPAAAQARSKRGQPLVLAADVTGDQPFVIIEPGPTLDPHQSAVVGWRNGPALVAAGAGSGKTFTLIERVAALLSEGVMPEAILVLVYNRKAADDMKVKLGARLGEALANRVGAFTFHGWGQRLLRRWGHPAADTVLGADEDSPSPYPIANEVLRAMNVQGEADGYITASGFIREALIDLAANDAVDRIAELRVAEGSLKLAGELLRFTQGYQRAKADRGAIDFADMLGIIGAEIQKGTQRAKALATSYRHVMVDEAQDANVARNVIGWHLGSGAQSFVAVGDLRQSIYGFTGARPDLFKGLMERGATLLTMPVNRRSTAAIVNAGNVVAEGRDWNLGGACEPLATSGEGAPVAFWECDESEGVQIAGDVQARIAAGLPLADAEGRANYACLVRTNALAASLEAALIGRGLPVRVLGSTGGVWGTAAGRHVLAYLTASEDRATAGLSAIANRPLRYLKADVVKPLVSKHSSGGLIAALRATYNRGAGRLADDLSRMGAMDWAERCEAVADLLVSDLKERAAEASEKLGAATHPDEDKAGLYKALAEAAAEAGSLAAIEGQIAALKRLPKDSPAVEISTCHKAKGAEWTVVYTTGVDEGVFPHMMAEDVEEERRLFYVAVTRAKRVSIVTCADAPSDFFTDLKAALAPVEPPPGGGVDPEQKDADLAHATAVAADFDLDGPVPQAAPVEAPVEEALTSGEEAAPAAAVVPAAEPVAETGRVFYTPAAMAEAVALAEAETAREPAAAPGEGGRYVQPTADEFGALMGALGFWEAPRDVTMRVHQRVWQQGIEAGAGLVWLRVYSTLPVGETGARECGEDSIKVAACYVSEDGKDRPLHQRVPYAARTRGWRVTVLKRVAEVAAMVEAMPRCERCGAPTRERTVKATGKKFHGCVAYPACKGSAKVAA